MTVLRYDVVDVFTDRPYAGNPLAVVHGAEDLSGAQARDLVFNQAKLLTEIFSDLKK